jgi:3-hydroxyisobutyrate dehydrogenase-like beta-hydroxyacid dehydrogenase
MSEQASKAKSTIGVVGLGIMGGAMARDLVKAGYAVVGFDVAPAAMQRLQAVGGVPFNSARQVAIEANVVIVSVATSAALGAVVQEIAAAQRKPGAPALLVLETSTLPIEDKEAALALLAPRGITVMDCPISGTAERLKERAWTVFCSGPDAVYQQARPIFQVFTDNTPNVGAFGNGTKMKFAANHLVAIYNVACAEAVALARKMGLDPQHVLDQFGPSPVVGTGVMRLRMPFMIRHTYQPATMKVEVWQKDMQVIGDMAKSVDCPTPLFDACRPIYTAAMAMGHSQDDTASVAEVLGAMAGLPSL